MRKNFTFLWFMVGLGESLQVVASLSITEIIVLILSPFIFMSDYGSMRRDGVILYFYLSILVFIGCLIGCWANNTHPSFVLRGLSVCALISCSIVFSHWLIRKDPNGFKWMFLGSAISLILCIFVFRRSVEVTMYGDDIQSIMNGQLFWAQRISPWIMLPTRGWYIHTPVWCNAIAPLVSAAIAAFLSGGGSGRSEALSMIAFAAVAIIGGKSRKTMERLRKHFFGIVIMAIVAVFLVNIVYRSSAKAGILGEKALEKYELQTRGGTGVIKLIIGGRMDSLVGLLAAWDKPILGYGPWAIDYGSKYRSEFIERFGTMEDLNDFRKMNESGYFEWRLNLIPCHSHITEFWLWYGIFGLLFILYSLFVIFRFIARDTATVPQWFGWLACGAPGLLWHIFFSPYASRVGFQMIIVACLMARAARKGRFTLPFKMLKESELADRR